MTERDAHPALSQSGVSMLEVLVAILVLSLGLLGMLGIILNSLKLTSSSSYRTTAATQAYALADSLRASVPQLEGYVDAVAAADSSCIGAGATGCTTDKIVETEIALWLNRLDRMLPSGTGAICRDGDGDNDAAPPDWNCSGAAGDPYVIKVCWNEARIAGAQVSADGSSKDWQCVRTNL